MANRGDSGRDSVRLRKGKVLGDANRKKIDEDSTVLGYEEHSVRPFLGKKRMDRTITLKRSTFGERRHYSSRVKPTGTEFTRTSELAVDPEGSRKPRIYDSSTSDDNGYSETHTGDYRPKPEQMVERAAHDLYQIKLGVDRAEARQHKKAA